MSLLFPNPVPGITIDISGALTTVTQVYGLNSVPNFWSPVSVVPVDSSQAQVSGFNNLLPVSGYALMTATMITDFDGDAVNVTRNLSDGLATSGLPALNVLSRMYGYYRQGGDWNRLTTALSSGSNNGDSTFSGHSLIVSIGDQGNIAHTTPTLDDGEGADKSLLTAAFNMGCDGASWYRIGVNAHGDLSNTNTLATFRGPAGSNLDVFTESDVTAASGGQTLPQIAVRGSIFIQGRITNSGWIRVGGNNAGDFPNQNNGFQLAPGESIELHLENADQINVIAQVSGDAVNVIVEN